ncbi:hypothetical protein FXO38_32391 [Capsicum annuum]|uniref:Uncharacterized protein n=1 Tax=Capsicum annuum TaxID=4072 RepID=A0A2G2Z9V2_CAPAN|nr:hypothetical protein FXO38_32391 [Capsicum annuum]KAF3625512.1 hypothetical protein FXO37_30813 [Capsicum annuum]PHT78787.1 hypothetical protein T459_16839 [Capsicum annuum]
MPLASTDSNVIIGKLVLFSKTLPSKYEDWEASTKALLDREYLINGGTIESVYRTSFEGGVSIAVKKHIETCVEQKNALSDTTVDIGTFKISLANLESTGYCDSLFLHQSNMLIRYLRSSGGNQR